MVIISQNKKDVVILGAGSHMWVQSETIHVGKAAGSIRIGTFSTEKETEDQMERIAQAYADGARVYHVPQKREGA